MRTPSCRLEYLVPSRVSDASNDDRLGSVIYQSATLPVAGGAGFMGVTTPVVGIGGVTGQARSQPARWGGGGLNLDGWNTRRTPPPLDIVRVTSSI